MVRIAVDEREKPSGVPDELRSQGASVEYRVLDVADYVVGEGRLDEELQRSRNPRSLWGGLISAVLDFGLHCFFTRDAEETAEFLITLGKGGRYKGRRGPPPLVVRKPRSKDVKRLQ